LPGGVGPRTSLMTEISPSVEAHELCIFQCPRSMTFYS
jgi:hypothetical protein